MRGRARNKSLFCMQMPRTLLKSLINRLPLTGRTLSASSLTFRPAPGTRPGSLSPLGISKCKPDHFTWTSTEIKWNLFYRTAKVKSSRANEVAVKIFTRLQHTLSLQPIQIGCCVQNIQRGFEKFSLFKKVLTRHKQLKNIWITNLLSLPKQGISSAI